MKINTRLDDYAAALRKSELDYFRAAAETRQLLHGELCYQSGFEKIASSCVLHNVSSLRCKMRPEVWLEQLLEEFVSIGAHCCRFYLTGAQSLDNSFIDNGLFKKVVEIGMLTDFSGVDPFDAVIPGQLLPIDNHKTLDLKRDLYRESALGPDGHDMHGGFFADFEHAKCRAGYMDSFLFIDDGQVKGAVSLAFKDDFARLKNLYVRPDQRAQGFAKQIVWLLMREALNRGAKAFGTYAVENKRSHHLYSSCGMVKNFIQIEGSMLL